MKIKKHIFSSPVYAEKEFIYYTYKNISNKEWLKLFKEKERKYNIRLYKGSTKKWLNSKAILYGVAISKKELIKEIIFPGEENPLSWYWIELR